VSDDNGGSIFKTALIATPFAIGVGYGARNLTGIRDALQNTPTQLSHSATGVGIRDFAQETLKNMPGQVTQTDTGNLNFQQVPSARKRWQLKNLNNFGKTTKLTVDQIRDAWSRAATAADPTGMTTRIVSQKLQYATTADGAARELAIVLGQGGGIHLDRAASIFLEDIPVLESRARQGLPVGMEALGLPVLEGTEHIARPWTSLKNEGARQSILQMEKLTGAKAHIEITSREGLGRQMQLSLRGGSLPGELKLNIGMGLKGQPGVMIKSGAKYITGEYRELVGGQLGKAMSHGEFALNRAVTDLIPEMMKQHRLTRSHMHDMVHQWEQMITATTEYVSPAIAQSQGLEEYIDIRSRGIRMLRPRKRGEAAYSKARGFNLPLLSATEYQTAIARGYATEAAGKQVSLFPGLSANQIAKSVMYPTDIRELASLVPEASEIARFPGKFLRPEFSPTASAMKAMASDQRQFDYLWAAKRVGVEAPMVSAAYLSADQYGAQMMRLGVSPEGQMVISKEAMKQLAVKETMPFIIASGDVAPEIKKMIDAAEATSSRPGSNIWNFNQMVKEGDLLGMSPEGRPVTAPSAMRIVAGTQIEGSASRGDIISLVGEREITDPKYAKLLGGHKGMAMVADSGYMDKFKKLFGISGADAIISMTELKKNRQLHYDQMFTSLWEMSQVNMSQAGNKQFGELSRKFVESPFVEVANMRAAAREATKAASGFSDELMLKQLWSIGKESRLTSKQIGGVFGAVPTVFDIKGGAAGIYDWMTGQGMEISEREAREMSLGKAVGTTQMFFGGLGGPGAGRAATIEPRMFELAGGAHFGALGPKIQKDIAERMMGFYPERLMEQSELEKALGSVTGLKKVSGARSAQEISAGLKDMSSLAMPSEAGYLRIKGVGDIYMPSATNLKQLAGYKTATGKVVNTDLSRAYRNVIDAAGEYDARNLTKEGMMAQVDKLGSELAYSKALTVGGVGGLLRGRLPGSMALTAVQPGIRDVNILKDRFTAGITANYAEKMFKDLEKLGHDVTGMQKKFMAGERIAGMVARHPHIGPYSTQAVWFRKIAGKEAVIAMNTEVRNTVMAQGKLEGNALRKFQRDGARRIAEGAASPILLSPMIGMAADTDGDVISAILAGPQLEKNLATHLADPEAMAAYREHSIRTQILKAKAGQEGVTSLRQIMAGQTVAVGITKRPGALGKVSMALQEGRAAVLANAGKLSGADSQKALGLLEWMENTPISGKHIKASESTKMIDLFDQIAQSMKSRDGGSISNVARSVMDKSTAEGKAALEGGLTALIEDPISGRRTTEFIPGIGIDKTAQNVAHSLRAMENVQVGGVNAFRLRNLLMGKAKPSGAREIAAMSNREALAMSPYGSFFADVATPKGSMANVVSKGMSMVNRMGAAGRSMIPWAKPVALGGAAAIGLATILSAPPRTLGPGANTPPRPILQSGSGGSNLPVGGHSGSATRGSPSAPSPIGSANTARIAGPSRHKISILGQSDGGADYSSLSQQLRNAVGGQASVSSTINDRRSSLTPQKLSDILNG